MSDKFRNVGCQWVRHPLQEDFRSFKGYYFFDVPICLTLFTTMLPVFLNKTNCTVWERVRNGEMVKNDAYPGLYAGDYYLVFKWFVWMYPRTNNDRMLYPQRNGDLCALECTFSLFSCACERDILAVYNFCSNAIPTVTCKTVGLEKYVNNNRNNQIISSKYEHDLEQNIFWWNQVWRNSSDACIG